MLQSTFAFIKYPLFASKEAAASPLRGASSGRSRQRPRATGPRLIRPALLAIALMYATPPLIAAERGHVLDIVDRVPKFKKFYDDAQGLSEGARWTLWKKEYGIAAVPPTPERPP